MKKYVFKKLFTALTLAVLMTSTVAATAYAKTIPEEYKEFTRRGSSYYHALTVTTNYDLETGEIVKRTRTPADGEPFNAYYVSVGNKTLILATPDGEILTEQELDEYFSETQTSWAAMEYGPMEWENEMVRLVNDERERLGLSTLKHSEQLTEIATLKAEEMTELNYFGHTSPNYGKPSQFAKHYGYGKNVSENIHRGTSATPQQVFDIWMNSTTGHRENMLNPKWKYIGVGWSNKLEYNGDGSMKPVDYYHVQLFSQ